MKFWPVLLLVFYTSFSACSQTKNNTFLALGDSYTIGESVKESWRWPNLLADTLNTLDFKLEKPTIIAKTGWTTNELTNSLIEKDLSTNFDMVSLLIGVNNQYRGYPIKLYKQEFTWLIKRAIKYADGKPERVFVVSIPNYGVTPFGLQKGENKIREELLIYDSIADSIASSYGIPFVNITPISEKAKQDPTFIAPDQLHPSAQQYREWVKLITPIAENILQKK